MIVEEKIRDDMWKKKEWSRSNESMNVSGTNCSSEVIGHSSCFGKLLHYECNL